jgi:hypothetical protein
MNKYNGIFYNKQKTIIFYAEFFYFLPYIRKKKSSSSVNSLYLSASNLNKVAGRCFTFICFSCRLTKGKGFIFFLKFALSISTSKAYSYNCCISFSVNLSGSRLKQIGSRCNFCFRKSKVDSRIRL